MQALIHKNVLLAYGQHCPPYTKKKNKTQKRFLKIVIKTPHVHWLFWKRRDICSEWEAVPEAFWGPQRLFFNSTKEQKKNIGSLNLIPPNLDAQAIYIPIKTNPACCFPSLRSFSLFPQDKHLDYKAKRCEKNWVQWERRRCYGDLGEAGNLNVTAFVALCTVKISRHSVQCLSLEALIPWEQVGRSGLFCVPTRSIFH